MELWYTEHHTPNAGLTLKVRATLFVGKSEYQSIEVLDTVEYGRVLLLDGLLMTSERDEYIYHEMITHPGLCLHPCPERVLVIGGGDGGAIREIIKHPEVEKAVLCEIDPMVVEVSRKFFPNIAKELTGNPRVEVNYQDGIRFLDGFSGYWDMIVVDSTDPIGPASGLFEKDFYMRCKNALRPQGILVAQSESPFYHLELQVKMKETLASSGFSSIYFYTAPVPTYPSGYWSWVMAGQHYHPLRDFRAERFERLGLGLHYYTPKIHQAAFCLPSFMQKALEGDAASQV